MNGMNEWKKLQKIQETLEKERKGLDLGFEKYRGSGLALTATLIGLSSGVIYFGFSKLGIFHHFVGYVACIIFSLLHQASHFRGGMNEARAQYFWYNAVAKYWNTTPQDDAILKEGAEKRDELMGKANFFYGRSDLLCELSVIVFIIQSLVLLGFVINWIFSISVGLVVLFGPKVAYWGDRFIFLCNKNEKIRSFIKKVFDY